MKKQHQIIQFFFILADSLGVALAWFLAYYLRFFAGVIPVYRGVPPFDIYATLVLLVVPIWLFLFRANKLYEMERGRRLVDEILLLIKGGSLATFILISLTFFYRQYTFSRAVIVLFWFLGIVLCSIGRAILHRVMKSLRRRGINVVKILVVGTGELAETVGVKIRQFPGLGLRLEGFIDAGNEPAGPGVSPRVVGTLDTLVPLLRERRIGQVIIALPREAHRQLEETLKALENEMVDVKVVPDLLQFVVVKTGLEELDGIPMISLADTPLSGWYSPVKRMADVVISLFFIIVGSPIILGAALAVKFSSPGPIIYRQRRMGLDGIIFTMYKFRSMRVDAEAATGAVWATKDDPRRTPIGTFLRRTSLDELPQLFNVLKGEMSFVGPRPERPELVEQFRHQIPRYMLRHRVKCGLTGWAQVCGYRGNTSLEKRIECDIFYIENWSMSFDIKIVWLTIWKGLIHKHAY